MRSRPGPAVEDQVGALAEEADEAGRKTVESHTFNIYAKLGVSSCVELATRLGEDERDS